MHSPRILVVGSSNTDMVVRVERIPRAGETVLGGSFLTAGGGKGANQAVAAAKAGGRVTFLGRVGRDVYGEAARASLRGLGIETKFMVCDAKEPSGVALILVARNGENSIAVAPGANGKLSAADVRKAKAAFVGARVLVAQLEVPVATVRAAVRLAQAQGVPVILNPAPARELPDALLREVAVLTPNETEAEILTGIKVRNPASARKAAEVLLARGVGAVVVTLGARGALLATSEGAKLVPGFAVKAVDTTAAGDTFNGALAVALAEGQTLEEAVRFANAAAAISVTRKGAQPSAPARREILRLLRGRRT